MWLQGFFWKKNEVKMNPGDDERRHANIIRILRPSHSSIRSQFFIFFFTLKLIFL